MLTRYDTAPINEMTQDAQTGFIHVTNVPIARVGVFPYLRADGSIEMEAKLPDELLSDSTVESANSKPVTNDHPKELVTQKNAKQYMKGFTADNAHVDNNTLRVDMTITDADLIKAVNDGKQELSIGFQTDVTPKNGEYNGVAYDSVQRNIQINHVAVVKRGRAGHTVRLIGDSAEMIDEKKGKNMAKDLKKSLADADSNTAPVNNTEQSPDASTSSNNSNTASNAPADNTAQQKQDPKDALIAQLKAQILDLKNQLAQLKGNQDDNQKSADESQAKADALEKELADIKKKVAGDALDKQIAERMDLIDEVKPYVGDSYDFKGKSARDLKSAVIKTVDDSIDLKDKSDNYVNAYFDAIRKLHKPAAVVGYQGPEIKGDSAENTALSLRNARYHLADKGGNK